LYNINGINIQYNLKQIDPEKNMHKFTAPKWLIWILLLALLASCTPATPAVSPTSVPVATDTAAPPPSPTPTPAPTATATPEPVAEQVVLTVVGPGGEKTLTLTQLKDLGITQGQAGTKSSTGKITVPAQYEGVSLLELAQQAGSLDPSMGVNVVAKDGYAMTFSYDQLTQGNFVAYDPATGDEKKMDDPLQVIVAYQREGQPIPEDGEGPLRLAIISPKNNQVTDGHWSVKWVNRIEVKPLGKEWSLQLSGVITDTVDRNSFQSCSAEQCHQAIWIDDKAQQWVGTPLWYLAGRMDDAVKHDGPAFNQSLADAGYLLQMIATDGYSVTLPISQVARDNNILVAYQVNQNPLPDKYFPLRLVGAALQKNQMAGQIAEIRMIIDPSVATQAAQPTPTATATEAPPRAQPSTVEGDLVIVGLVDEELGLNEADLRKMDVVEVTAEHPKKGKETYQGVRLSALLELAKVKSEAAKIVFTAADGYAAETDLGTILSCTDCLLAFTNTPGKFKLVMPGLESALWVKDVIKFEVK
jgi:DMSO/TMAO reductase YedYZ molybdopterin-dependent catalytic subunit